MKPSKTQTSLFAAEEPQRPIAPQEALINIWFTASGKPCMIVLRGDKQYLYLCPVCGAYNNWDKISTGTCCICKCHDGKGFEIDKEKGIANVYSEKI